MGGLHRTIRILGESADIISTAVQAPRRIYMIDIDAL
jgi:hypothetical protein